MLCQSFPPVIDPHCHTLILGSMPGIRSLQQQEYYAHPANRFWPLLAKILGTDPLPNHYSQRIEMLLSHHLALWDSLGSCVRTGSLDSAIHSEQANDFPALFATYPNLKKICFNGAKAAQAFAKHYRNLQLDPQKIFISLPSTSPANARWHKEELEAIWRKSLLE